MAGRLMNKEDLYANAKRLGINVDGLSWPQKQKAVLEALDLEAAGKKISEQSMEEILEVIPGNEVVVHVETEDPDLMDLMRGKKIIICPEMAQTTKQYFGYDEVLEDDLEVEEINYNLLDGSIPDAGASSTFKVIGKTGKKVIAKSALPKEGCEISFRPDVDWFPVCTFQHRSGYLWTHQRLPNVKNALIQSGYYQEFRNRFEDEPYIWHSGGKLLACDINLVHSIMKEIERRERDNKIQDQQRDEFVRHQMNLKR